MIGALDVVCCREHGRFFCAKGGTIVSIYVCVMFYQLLAVEIDIADVAMV